MQDSKGYVDSDYLQYSGQSLHELKAHGLRALDIQPGNVVLDLGSGIGLDTVRWAELVGPAGRVIGVDHDTGMIAAADRRAADAGVSRFVQYVHADAHALPFPADFFDRCHAERVFQHLTEPEKVLAEIVRVTRPGGKVVVLDIDCATLTVDHPNIDLERRIVRAHGDFTLHNGYIGRQLYRLFRHAGLVDLQVQFLPLTLTDYTAARYLSRFEAAQEEALSHGMITRQELYEWVAALVQAAVANSFFAAVSMVLASGYRPQGS